MNRRGQALIEFSLGALLILVPLVLGGMKWFTLEINRAKCAHLAFQEARMKLIRSHRAVSTTIYCNGQSETIQLVPLEALDPKSRAFSL